MSIRYVAGHDLKIWLPPGSAHLRIEIAGDRTILSAIVRRCFPTSEPERFLSLQDGAGQEVAVLRSLAELEPEAQSLVKAELERRYFTPKIRTIHTLKQDAGMWLFRVSTQRGDVTFYVRNWRDSAHEVAPGRLQIHSVDGQRFEIEDYGKLDERSQVLMEQLG